MEDTKQAGHTPGPWTVANGLEVIADFDGMMGTVAKAHKVSGEQDLTEAQANARLIAAAPELLEALKSLLRADLETNGVETKRYDSCINKAQAAINRATGRA